MEKKAKHPAKGFTAAPKSTEANVNHQAITATAQQGESPQTPAEKTRREIIIHHQSKSGYDHTALKKIQWFLKRWPKRRTKAIVRFIRKTNQTGSEYNGFIMLNERSIKFRQTVEEIYQDALNWDIERPSYVRIWCSNKVTHYVCAPQCSIYGDYVGDLRDDKGWLKQEVIDEAIRELKAELLVGKETTNV